MTEIKDAPFGFRPIRHKSGAPYTGACTAYWLDSSDSTALYIGDPVVRDGTSSTAEVSAMSAGKFDTGHLTGVTRATAGATNKVIGVVVGVAAVTQDSLIYRAASTERIVYVADDPDLVFEVQVDAALPTASIGLDTNILFTHAGSTVTGLSGAEVDATASADATYQAKILGFKRSPENTANTAGNIVEIMWNLHELTTGVGQAGV